MTARGVVQEGQLRFYCYTDFVLLAVTPRAAYKIARITWGRDGSLYVQFPYCTEKQGWIGELPIAPGQHGPVTYKLSDHGEYVETDVKFSHHTSGFVRFSKSGDETIPRTGRKSWPLTGPLGHLFDLQIVEPERFAKLEKPDKRAMHLGVHMEPGSTSLSWHAEWRRKHDFVEQFDPPHGVAGPTAKVMSRASGQTNETFFLGQPEGFGARDHILLLTTATPKVPEGFTGPGMTFLGGWDYHEVARGSAHRELGGCLAFVYPFRRSRVEGSEEGSVNSAAQVSLSEDDQEQHGDGNALVIPYNQFIAERHKIIEARSRAQQRVDQLVTGGAAGALVLSITFLEKIAPSPYAGSQRVLIVAWALLLVSLGLNLISHFASCSAFDRYLEDFDRAYREKSDCSPNNPATRLTRWAEIGSALTFVAGVGFLAIFALLNVQFDRAENPQSSRAAITQPVRQSYPQLRGPHASGSHDREESRPAAPTGAAAAAAAASGSLPAGPRTP